MNKTWSLHSKEHLLLAWPLCLGQAGQQVMSLVDSAMVGHFDRVALAGFGIANSLLLALTFFGVGIMLALDTLIPQAMGRNDRQEAESLFQCSKSLALRIGIPLTLAGALAPLLLSPLGVQAEVAKEASLYLYGRLPSLVPFLLFTSAVSLLQATDRTRLIALTVLIGNLLNIIADGLLVFGDATLLRFGLPPIGLPALGGLGASISTCIVVFFMAFCVLVVLKTTNEETLTKEKRRKGEKRILKLGFPIGLQLLAEVGIFALVGILSGILGVLPGASNQLALAMASLPFSLAIGMSAASSVRVGNAVGRQDHQEARRAGLTALFWGASLMCCIGVFFVMTPKPLLLLFTDDEAIIQACIPLLAITAVFQLSDATQAIIAGALRGAGDTRVPLLANIIGHYGVGLWVAIGLGFGLGHGVSGLWWGLASGLTVAALLLWRRFWNITAAPIVMV